MMKKIILIALIYSTTAVLAHAGSEGETKTVTVKVSVLPSDVINIEAKHTELLVETWSKNEVEIEASIRFDGKMTNKMQTFLDEFEEKVNSKVSNADGQLKIDTDLNVPNKVQIGGDNVGINISYGGKELKVIYKIKAPENNDYLITNSYEEVRLSGNFDYLDFTQYSGELEADNIKSGKLNMKYGKATIGALGDAEMQIYEQKLAIDELGELDLNAKYSELEFGSVEKIDAVSYESDYEISSAGILNGNFKYGKIDISETIDEAELVFYEMDIEANEIGSLLMKNSKYSKFEFSKAGKLVFDQSYEDETDIGYLGSLSSPNSKYGNHSIDVLEGKFILNAYEDETKIDELGSDVSEITINGKYLENSIGIGNSEFIMLFNVKYGKAAYDESEINLKRYIKDGDQLEVEIHSKTMTSTPTRIAIKGYEVDVILD